MNLHDRINLANADHRDEHEQRRVEYWERLKPRKIGERRDSYMDLMWVWLGLGAAILGAILAVRL